MADVSRDRAQFFIVSGLVLAVLLVALALILNSAIYTGNLATRQSSHDTRAALQERHVVDDAVGRAIRYANIHQPGNPQGQLADELASLETELNEEALNGVVVGVEQQSVTSGTRIAQLDDGQFTAGGTNDGVSDWKLMENTKDTKTFALRMQRTSLLDADLLTTGSEIQTNAFEVRLTDLSNSDVYHVYIFQSSVTGNAYLVTVKNSNSLTGSLLDIVDGACAATGPQVIANFRAGTFGPAPDVENPYAVSVNPGGSNACSELDFFDTSTEYRVEYVNGQQVQGEYELITTRTYADLRTDEPAPTDVDNFFDPGGQDPFSHEGILSATVEVEYETSQVNYVVESKAERRRERVFTGYPPTIEEFTVTDTTDLGDASDEPTFEVDWEAGDLDGDMEKVTITLYDRNDDEKADQVTYTTGDPELDSDSGSDDNVVLQDSDDTDSKDDSDEQNGDYKIVIEVVDAEGHVSTSSDTQIANGDPS